MVQTKNGACRNEWIVFMRESGRVYRERRALGDELEAIVVKARRSSEVLKDVDGEIFQHLGDLLVLLRKLDLTDRLLETI